MSGTYHDWRFNQYQTCHIQYYYLPLKEINLIENDSFFKSYYNIERVGKEK